VPGVTRTTRRSGSGISDGSVSKFPSKPGFSPNTVALGSSSTTLPHFEQKRAVSGSCWPQLVQNMRSRILSLRPSYGEHLASLYGLHGLVSIFASEMRIQDPNVTLSGRDLSTKVGTAIVVAKVESCQQKKPVWTRTPRVCSQIISERSRPLPN